MCNRPESGYEWFLHTVCTVIKVQNDSFMQIPILWDFHLNHLFRYMFYSFHYVGWRVGRLPFIKKFISGT